MLNLTTKDKDDLIKRFPSIELCYESNIEHNKVSASFDYYSLIPKGRKMFLWTTYFKEHNKISFALELNKGAIENIKHIELPTQKEHAYGTIFYGTAFSSNFFSIENIHYYKGQNTERNNNNEQLMLCKEYMQFYCSNINLSKSSSFKMGIPYMSNEMNDCIRMKNLLPYRVFCIQHKKYNWNNKKLHFSFIKNNVYKSINIHFEVKADVQNDVYYCYYNDSDEPYCALYIPDIKTSVMMNKLFRIIKENDNLDALEESDDEEEFENIDEDKFVLKNKIFVMDCAYNPKFKKWYPICLSKQRNCTTTLQNIKKHEQNLTLHNKVSHHNKVAQNKKPFRSNKNNNNIRHKKYYH